MRLTRSKNVLHFGIKCSKSLRFRPRPRWGNLRRSHRPPSREGLLAFGNRSFAPSALALSPILSIGLSVSPNFSNICPQSYVQIYASMCRPPYLFFCNSTTGLESQVYLIELENY